MYTSINTPDQLSLAIKYNQIINNIINNKNNELYQAIIDAGLFHHPNQAMTINQVKDILENGFDDEGEIVQDYFKNNNIDIDHQKLNLEYISTNSGLQFSKQTKPSSLDLLMMAAVTSQAKQKFTERLASEHNDVKQADNISKIFLRSMGAVDPKDFVDQENKTVLPEMKNKTNKIVAEGFVRQLKEAHAKVYNPENSIMVPQRKKLVDAASLDLNNRFLENIDDRDTLESIKSEMDAQKRAIHTPVKSQSIKTYARGKDSALYSQIDKRLDEQIAATTESQDINNTDPIILQNPPELVNVPELEEDNSMQGRKRSGATDIPPIELQGDNAQVINMESNIVEDNDMQLVMLQEEAKEFTSDDGVGMNLVGGVEISKENQQPPPSLSDVIIASNIFNDIINNQDEMLYQAMIETQLFHRADPNQPITVKEMQEIVKNGFDENGEVKSDYFNKEEIQFDHERLKGADITQETGFQLNPAQPLSTLGKLMLTSFALKSNQEFLNRSINNNFQKERGLENPQALARYNLVPRGLNREMGTINSENLNGSEIDAFSKQMADKTNEIVAQKFTHELTKLNRMYMAHSRSAKKKSRKKFNEHINKNIQQINNLKTIECMIREVEQKQISINRPGNTSGLTKINRSKTTKLYQETLNSLKQRKDQLVADQLVKQVKCSEAHQKSFSVAANNGKTDNLVTAVLTEIMRKSQSSNQKDKNEATKLLDTFYKTVGLKLGKFNYDKSQFEALKCIINGEGQYSENNPFAKQLGKNPKIQKRLQEEIKKIEEIQTENLGHLPTSRSVQNQAVTDPDASASSNNYAQTGSNSTFFQKSSQESSVMQQQSANAVTKEEDQQFPLKHN